MSFEEKFPNVAKYCVDDFDFKDLKNTEFCFSWQVEKFCLSKQRVKKAILKFYYIEENGNGEQSPPTVEVNKLWKELNLE